MVTTTGLGSRALYRRVVVALILSIVALGYLLPDTRRHAPHIHGELEEQYPLLWRHVHSFNGTGGAWYLPPHWVPTSDFQPDNIVDAALLASQAAAADPATRMMAHSSVPLILHQTWKTRDVTQWSPLLRQGVERWLHYVVSSDMAFLFWEDDGIVRLLAEFEPDFAPQFAALPTNVERSDVFRILAVKWFGGIYADIDTQPLRQPASWVSWSDLSPWTDPLTDQSFRPTQPVKLILGIEADCRPESDDYWRMGYAYPVQLTQWALAATAGHPVLLRFMDLLSQRLLDVALDHGGSLDSDAAAQDLRRIGPVSLTGPIAVTAATQTWLEEQTGLRWNALTGLADGGRSKLVDDVLILPITGFSPGRGRYGNMGSKAVSDPSARLWHRAQGSWRSVTVSGELVKFCRSAFGMCRASSPKPP